MKQSILKFHWFLFTLTAFLCLPVFLFGAASDASDLQQLFAYDTNAALNTRVIGVQQKDGVKIEDITFAGADGTAIEAYVVRPDSGTGPFAGVLFVHWFAPPDPTSNRTQFLAEAEALARRGTVSLLVSTFWSDPARYEKRKWETDFQNSVDQTKNLRRALDVLLAQSGVDQGRIAYVGHDYGAMFGALVAAVDPRPRAYVHIAGTARFTDWYLFGSSTGVPKGDALAGFRKQMEPIEPVHAIAKMKAPVFFQWGEKDPYTPRKDFLDLYLAAPGEKCISTYQSEHAMNADIIRQDRTVWLSQQLSIK